MGNCQAAEAATVVIQHPPGNNNTKRVDMIYWPISAHEVMNSNPGHYVALVVTSPPPPTENGSTPVVKHVLKLLKPDDTLLIGQVYRLISFEDVLKEFATKKSVKLGKLLKERSGDGGGTMKSAAAAGVGVGFGSERRKNSGGGTSADTEEVNQLILGTSSSINGGGGSSSSRVVRRQHQYSHGGGHWRPALQSISEMS
ncbi:hypothetical protein LINPERHAP1_LOCUS27387 [Linum perenne]